MEHDEIQTRLRNLAFTSGIFGDSLDQLAALTTPVKWKTDEVVFREGDVGKALYIVEDGRVAITVHTPSGPDSVTILTIGRGQVFGWSSVFYDRPKSAGARALAPTTALAIDARGLADLFDRDPELGYTLTRRLLQVVSERLKATRVQLLDVFAKPEDRSASTPR